MASPRNNSDINQCQDGDSETKIKQKWQKLQKTKIIHQLNNQNECKSGSSTSPGSNLQRINCRPKTKISKKSIKNVFISQFEISRTNSKGMFEVGQLTDFKENRRNEKLSYKKLVTNKDDSEAKSDPNKSKGCT